MRMKKCPYCAENILDEAIKCKHCGSEITNSRAEQKKNRHFMDNRDQVVFKWIGKIILVIIAIYIWYLSIPAILIWYIWKKTKWSKKKKYIGTALSFALFCLLVGLYANITRTPHVTITEPIDGFTIQASETNIKGTVDPKDAVVNIKGTIVNTNDGKFNYLAKLTEEKNIFTIKISNKNGESQQQITINRTFTAEEIIERERIKAEEEARRQAAIEAQKKAEEERKAKELAEQRAWDQSKAGQICKKHPKWSKDDCISLANDEFWIGMSYEMLIFKRGKPNSTNPSNYGSGTQWQWCWYNYSPSCFYDHNDDGIIDSYN